MLCYKKAEVLNPFIGGPQTTSASATVLQGIIKNLASGKNDFILYKEQNFVKEFSANFQEQAFQAFSLQVPSI